MNEPVVIPSPGCVHLGIRLAQLLGAEVSPMLSREFPDGELYVRVPTNVSGKTVVLVECAGRRPNIALVEALLAVKTLQRLGAREIILAMPYFPYARQDSEFSAGEAVSVREVAELLELIGVSSVITVDMHLHRYSSVGELFRRIKAVNVSAMRELALFVHQNYGGGFTVVAPDEEARQWASIFAEEVGVPYIVLEKERRGDEDVTVKGTLSVIGKAVIVDDIISTGSTVVSVIEKLRAAGAKDIVVACTHGLFVAGADAKILLSGARDIVTSDTVPNPFARVSAARPLADGVKMILDGELYGFS